MKRIKEFMGFNLIAEKIKAFFDLMHEIVRIQNIERFHKAGLVIFGDGDGELIKMSQTCNKKISCHQKLKKT